MEKCIFCEIVAKRMPAKAVYEDGDCVAFLDINPRSKGMTIVAAKKHYENVAEDVPTSVNIFKVAIAIENAIKKALEPNDISMAVLPSPMNHFHIRLYPVYEGEIPIGEAQPKQTSDEELNDTAMKITSVGIEVEKKKPVIEEKIEEPEQKEPVETRTEDEIEEIRREIESG